MTTILLHINNTPYIAIDTTDYERLVADSQELAKMKELASLDKSELLKIREVAKKTGFSVDTIKGWYVRGVNLIEDMIVRKGGGVYFRKEILSITKQDIANRKAALKAKKQAQQPSPSPKAKRNRLSAEKRRNLTLNITK
jgi:hypothetical protein